MSMFADVYKKYHTDIIFYQIKELYLNIANAAQPSEEINKANNSSNNANVKYSLYKLKGNYKEKMKEIINGINGVNVENENKKEEEEKVIKMSDNKYTEQIEKLMKKREEDERKENDFILKTETCFNHYEREEFVDFLRLINEDERLKNKIFTDKGENFKNNIVFEEKLLNYFLNEINTKEGYTKIKNNNFDMAFKQGKNDITIFFEKVLDISIVNLLSLIYEVEFYNKWFPFCKTSNCLIQPGKARKLVYLVNAIPIISDRDFLIYGFGVNRMQDNNTMLLLCKSIDAESGIFQEQFSKKKSKKFVRADINIFGFEMKILSKNKVHVKALLNADPKIGFIPQWIINTVSEKVIIRLIHTHKYINNFLFIL